MSTLMRKVIQLGKRWMNILLGKSAVAVEQPVGKCYSKSELKGYYNDLTGKVSPATPLDADGIPVNVTSKGETVYSLVTIMQYALGCHDIFLIGGDELYRKRFLKLADYILARQEATGKWDARASIGSYKGNSSCMAQGQGCSILLRAAQMTGNPQYVQAAEKAISFMLLPCGEGGTAVYAGDDVSFEKYPPQNGVVSSVLNGWAFALFGLYDYVLFSQSENHRRLWEMSCKTLEERLPQYDRRSWSNYDLIGTISSPAYHGVHISLLRVLADLSDSKQMSAYAERFESYSKSPAKQFWAIVTKLMQKLTQPADAFFIQ